MMNFILKKDNKNTKEKERDELLRNIALAHKEWKDKENYFQAVTDHDLVDYSIYEIEASRRKYLYLLKKMREIHETSQQEESTETSMNHS